MVTKELEIDTNEQNSFCARNLLYWKFQKICSYKKFYFWVLNVCSLFPNIPILENVEYIRDFVVTLVSDDEIYEYVFYLFNYGKN